jgi:23S rRNA (cytosine1962-C5)-methyltransferase
MEDVKHTMFINRLSKVYRHRSKIARRMGISCYRVYDHDLPEYPICIEKFGDIVYVAEYRRKHRMETDEHQLWIQRTKEAIAVILSCTHEQIFLKERRKLDHRNEQQYEKDERFNQAFTVEENGLQFLIQPGTYLDTGLFLDHRMTRRLVQEKSFQKTVLNLFCYTGSFSVYAASGGATRVDSVDMSHTYLEWAKKNFQANNLLLHNHRFIQADVIQWIKEAPANEYDLIIIDPPTFSNSKRMKGYFEVQEHHVYLLNHALKILKKGGLIYFSTNFSKFKMETNELNITSVKDITKQTTPFDFEGKLQRFCFELSK